MADHIDKQIRDYATTLLTGLTTTGTRVFKSRAHPMQDANMPGLRIYVDNSDIDVAMHNGRAGTTRLRRLVQLVVEFCGKATSAYDDESDAAKKEVEQAIAGDYTLGGKVRGTELTRIETDRDGDGDKVVIVTRMTFECEAYTARNAPDTPL